MAAMVKGKGETASEAQKWNPGSETDPMVVVASSAEVRCGGGVQKGAPGNSSVDEPGVFQGKGRKHCVERCEAKPMAWTVSSGNEKRHRK